jgi:hypothetical protein
MAAFDSTDGQVLNMSANNRRFPVSFYKQFNPTAAAVAGESHTLFRGGGYPQADALFDTGTNLLYQGITDLTTNAGCIQHGGNIGANGDGLKVLVSGYANTNAATVAPCTLMLIDVVAFIRVTTVTTTGAQSVINSNTFTASSSSGLLLTYTNDFQNYQKVRFTTTTTLPTGLTTNTDYFLIRVSATTARVATTYANAIAGTAIAFTDAGTGTHTMTVRHNRYGDGDGIQAMFFNPSSTALGAGTPVLTLPNYTNQAGTGSRATPTSPSGPVSKSASTNSHILYSGATGAGKFPWSVPLQATDTGIRSITSIQNNLTMTSGSYTVALYQELGIFDINVQGQGCFISFTQDHWPSHPPVYDGAALYLLCSSTVATPANSLVRGRLNFGWSP